METKIKWYIGQKVWDKTVSDEEGIVHNINFSPDLPIVVIFGDVNKRINARYSIEGVLDGNILPTLSTTPYEIKMEGFSQEVEEELPKEGQIVWAKIDDDENWAIAHFLRKQSTHYLVSGTNSEKEKYPCNQITTKNPYEDVSEMENTDREPGIGDMCFFWSYIEPYYATFGELVDNRSGNAKFPYRMKGGLYYEHCSLKNPLIK